MASVFLLAFDTDGETAPERKTRTELSATFQNFRVKSEGNPFPLPASGLSRLRTAGFAPYPAVAI